MTTRLAATCLLLSGCSTMKAVAIAPGGAPVVAPRCAAAVGAAGGVEVFYVRPDGILRHRHAEPGQGGAAPVLLADGSPARARSVAMARDGGGELEVFFTDDAGRVFHLTQAPRAGWSAPAPFFQLTARQLVVTEGAGGGLVLVAVDASGALAVAREDLRPAGRPLGAPAGGPGRGLRARRRGPRRDRARPLPHAGRWQARGLLRERVRRARAPASALAGGGWTAAEEIAAAADTVAAAADADGRLEVFYTGPGGNWLHRWERSKGGEWAAPEPFGWTGRDMATALGADGRLKVFYTDATGVVMHQWQLGPGVYWSGEYPLGDRDRPLVWADTSRTVKLLPPRFPN
jgi:hypothetical protein